MPSNKNAKPEPKAKPRAVNCITCSKGGSRYEAEPGEDMSFLPEKELARLKKSGAVSDG